MTAIEGVLVVFVALQWIALMLTKSYFERRLEIMDAQITHLCNKLYGGEE